MSLYAANGPTDTVKVSDETLTLFDEATRPCIFDNTHRFKLTDTTPVSEREDRNEMTAIRTENRRDSTRAVATDTAQEVRRIARQLSMLTVDATESSIRHKRGVASSELSSYREPVRVVAKDLALETIPATYSWGWFEYDPQLRLSADMARPGDVAFWIKAASASRRNRGVGWNACA